jgi:uncharacterized protein (DUF362 family)
MSLPSPLKKILLAVGLFEPLRRFRDRGRLAFWTAAGRLRRGGRSAHRRIFDSDKALRARLDQWGSGRSAGPEGAHSSVGLAWIKRYDDKSLKRQVQNLLEHALPDAARIKSGSRVVIKVNMAGQFGAALDLLRSTGLSPVETYWTHPRAVRAFAELVRDAGAREVVIVEALYDQPTYLYFGFEQIVKRLGARFVDLNFPAPYADFVDVPAGPKAHIYPSFKLNPILIENDLFVSFAKLKRHHLAGLSLTLKNLIGIMPVRFYRRNESENNRSTIHHLPDGANAVSRVILDLVMARPIDLGLIDGVLTTLGSEGPWNNDISPVAFNAMICSRDPVAVDAVGARMMGYDPLASDYSGPFPNSINYLSLARELTLGTNRPEDMDLIWAYDRN